MSEPVNADTVTSHEQDGRVLSGVGVSVEHLAETMERHAPPEPVAPPNAGEPTPATGTPEAPAAPPQTRGRQRFSDLTRERDEARAETSKERAEREAIAKENAELRARISQPPAQPRREPQPEPTTQPKRETFPTFDEFTAITGNEDADWYTYSDARVTWQYAHMRAQERAEESSREDARAFQAHVSRYMTELEDARRTIPDIETAIAAVPLGIGVKSHRTGLHRSGSASDVLARQASARTRRVDAGYARASRRPGVPRDGRGHSALFRSGQCGGPKSARESRLDAAAVATSDRGRVESHDTDRQRGIGGQRRL